MSKQKKQLIVTLSNEMMSDLTKLSVRTKNSPEKIISEFLAEEGAEYVSEQLEDEEEED